MLEGITAEAVRAGDRGEEKRFRLADLDASSSHLHTGGGLGCAAAFSVNLTAAEWRRMAKKVVRAEVYGSNGNGDEDCGCFMKLVEKMENRQRRFIQGTSEPPRDFPKDSRTGGPVSGRGEVPESEHVCLKYVGYARELVEGFDWS